MQLSTKEERKGEQGMLNEEVSHQTQTIKPK